MRCERPSDYRRILREQGRVCPGRSLPAELPRRTLRAEHRDPLDVLCVLVAHGEQGAPTDRGRSFGRTLDHRRSSVTPRSWARPDSCRPENDGKHDQDEHGEQREADDKRSCGYAADAPLFCHDGDRRPAPKARPTRTMTTARLP
jgi:hypothetical protein